MLSYPLLVLRVTLQAYLWPRFVSYLGIVAEPVIPTQGIIAGSFAATYEVKVVMIRHLDSFVQRHNSIHLNFHIDDSCLEGHNKSEAVLEHALAVACEDLSEVLEIRLRLPLAYHKACVVSNRHAVAEPPALSGPDRWLWCAVPQ